MFLNDRNKIKKSIATSAIFDAIESDNSGISKILKVNETTITFLMKNVVVEYDYVQNKTLKTYDVNKWNTHQTVLEGSTLWVISGGDGELYGLKLD